MWAAVPCKLCSWRVKWPIVGGRRGVFVIVFGQVHSQLGGGTVIKSGKELNTIEFAAAADHLGQAVPQRADRFQVSFDGLTQILAILDRSAAAAAAFGILVAATTSWPRLSANAKRRQLQAKTPQKHSRFRFTFCVKCDARSDIIKMGNNCTNCDLIREDSFVGFYVRVSDWTMLIKCIFPRINLYIFMHSRIATRPSLRLELGLGVGPGLCAIIVRETLT